MKTCKRGLLIMFVLSSVCAGASPQEGSSPASAEQLKIKLDKFDRERGMIRMVKQNLVLEGSLAREVRQRNILAGGVVLLSFTLIFMWFRRNRLAVLVPVLADNADFYHGPDRKVNGLSEREKEILRHLVGGLSHKQIAFECGITYHTVRYHIKNIYTKLKVKSLTEAVATALRQKIID